MFFQSLIKTEKSTYKGLKEKINKVQKKKLLTCQNSVFFLYTKSTIALSMGSNLSRFSDTLLISFIVTTFFQNSLNLSELIQVKFRYFETDFEKATKIWKKIFHFVWRYLAFSNKNGRFFFKFCGLLTISELYIIDILCRKRKKKVG